jgi:hypothetical protein
MQQKTYQHIAAAAIALLLFAGTRVHAQQAQTASPSNYTISYQGSIVEMDGSAVKDSSYPITVSIWTDATQGTRLWHDVFQTVVKGGIFNILLGSQIPLPAPALMDQPLWLGVSFNTDMENLPRFALGTVPSAMNVADSAITSAKIADGAVRTSNLADSAITTAKIADGAITWDKMGTDYVPYIRVNGAKVTTGQNSINFTGGNGLMVNYDSTSMSLIFQPDTTLSAGNIGKGLKTLSIGTDWVEGGNTDVGTTSPSDNYFGTQNSEPVWIRVNGGVTSGATTGTAMRFIPGGVTPNVVGGDASNVGDNIAEGADFLGGGQEDTVRSQNSSVVGGYGNTIDTNSYNSMIGGGVYNKIYFSTQNAVIGGGVSDTIRNSSNYAMIGGGQWNMIDSSSTYSFIGGGDSNLIVRTTKWGKNDHTANYATIAGGYHNSALDYATFVGGGESNLAGEEDGSVVGGLNDTVLSSQSTIAGGYDNRIGINEIDRLGDSAAEQSFIGSGYWNKLDAAYSAIVAGRDNRIDSISHCSFIGGGDSNHINTLSSFSAVGGGLRDTINSPNGFVGGGMQNVIASGSMYAAIVGGDSNQIQSNYNFSAIVGGAHNKISIDSSITGRSNFMGAGDSNLIDGHGVQLGTDPANADAIVAGIRDTIHEALSFIGSGQNNRIWDDGSFIGAGTSNVDSNGSENAIVAGRGNKIDVELLDDFGPAFIGGGDSNTTLGSMSVIGGGHGNKITANGPNAAIPGGDSLTANSFAQAVVGYNNIVSGTFTQGTTHIFAMGGIQDQPLFIVGNGDNAANQSNAFTVSYDGHSTVTDNNGSGGASVTGTPPLRADVYGSSYQDNQIVAWAQVPANTTPGPLPINHIISDFAVATVTNSAAGRYDFLLNNAHTFTTGSVVATLVTTAAVGPLGNRFLTTTIPTGNPCAFTVFVCDNANNPKNDVQFTVQVVGR